MKLDGKPRPIISYSKGSNSIIIRRRLYPCSATMLEGVPSICITLKVSQARSIGVKGRTCPIYLRYRTPLDRSLARLQHDTQWVELPTGKSPPPPPPSPSRSAPRPSMLPAVWPLLECPAVAVPLSSFSCAVGRSSRSLFSRHLLHGAR